MDNQNLKTSESDNNVNNQTAGDGVSTSKPYRVEAFFKDLLPKLPPENRAELKDLIAKHGGCFKPLIVWKEERVLLDGHHRDELLDELLQEGANMRQPSIEEMSFASRAEAATWIIRHQNGQRPSWSKFEMAQAFLRNSELIAELEKAAEKRMKGGVKVADDQKSRTIDLIAQALKVGRTTVYHAQKAIKAEDELKQFEDAEKILKYPKLAKMIESGKATLSTLKSAVAASDRAEALNKLAAEARKQLPSFDKVEGDVTNSIIHGDALESLRDLPSESVSLIFTSPPYPILGIKYRNYEYDGDYSKLLDYLNNCWTEAMRILVDGGRLAVNFDNPFVQVNERTDDTPMRRNVYADLHQQLSCLGFKFRDSIIWDKGNATAFTPVAKNTRTATNPKLSMTYEFIAVYSKGQFDLKPQWKDKPIEDLYDLNDKEWHDWRNKLWEIPPVRNKVNHPCPFPLELAERVVRLFSFRGDTVLDPFAGTGTTCAAAATWGRQYIGIDNDSLSVLDAQSRVAEAISEAKKMADTEKRPRRMTKARKQEDILRRLKTVTKHRNKESKDAVQGITRRYRKVTPRELKKTPSALNIVPKGPSDTGLNEAA